VRTIGGISPQKLTGSHDKRPIHAPVTGIVGHRQVTDAYLAHLARSYSTRLATFDQALAKLHEDDAD
jgi:predicted nucleic acid-binding protein